MTMAVATDPMLTFVALLGACVWVGGLVAILVVVRVARQQLDRSAQVAFFRTFGRRYVRVGAPALVLALGAGAVLLAERPWDGSSLAAVLVSVTLVLATTAGVGQARGMTRLRARALGGPGDDHALAERMRRGSVRAAVLRAVIGLLSLGLLALASVLAS